MSKNNQEIVLKLYNAFAQGNLQYIAEKIAPKFITNQTDELPWGGVYEGFVEYQTFVKKLREFIESRVTVEETFEAGDQVVVIARTKGHVMKTGVPFDIRSVYVWTLKEGHATRFDAYIDTPAMLHVLGQHTANE